MTTLVRVELDDGATLLLETAEPVAPGPVKAGRAADAVLEVQENLRTVLRPVVQASREVLAELREAGPDEVKVEFGVALTSQAGAIIARAGANCHFTVTLTWKNAEPS